VNCPLQKGDVKRPFPRPDWRRRWPVRALRFAFQQGFLFPLARTFVSYDAKGVENLDGLEPPVIFVANHTSHLDTVAVLRSVPARWRYRLAPVITIEWFRSLFQPEGHTWSSRALRTFQYGLCGGGGNAVLLANCSCHLRQSLVYIQEQMQSGICPLFFPEGTRTSDGTVHQFHAGVGWLAKRVGAAVVPIGIHGLFEIYPKHALLPRRGRVRVRIGKALRSNPDGDYRALTAEVERAVCSLAEDVDRRSS
jgi:long-chain acyl-CoA synthetase